MILTINTNCSEKPNNSKQERVFKKLVRNKEAYYSIIYEKDGEEYEGYSSYSLDVISDFLKEYFLPEPKQSVGTTDAVSRNAIIRTLNAMDRYIADELTLCDTDRKFPKNEVFIVDDVYEEIVEQLPSVQPDLTKLLQELWTKTCLITDSEGLQHQVIHAMDDLISRQEIIDLLSDYKDRLLGALDCMDIVGIERRIIESCLELIEECIKDIESLDNIAEVSKNDIRSLVSSKNPDILNLQENKFKDNLFDIHNVTQNSKDYPSSVMDIVPNKDKYHLISINGLIVLPLFEFIDYVKRDNK